ncbi:MAG: NRDE family protein [Planctomycetota bacterium]
MCTVTVIPLAGAGLRLVSNRDELRTRPPSSLPREHAIGGGRALWPVDPTGGGTWIGVSDHGVAMSLLNLNLDPRPSVPDNTVSRGSIITSVIEQPTGARVIEAVRSLDLARAYTFRLVVADARGVWCARWDRDALTIDEHPLAPICFASSGLGDHLVQERLPLWDEMVRERGATPVTQDAFHAHETPGRGFASVLMDRELARTTSTTVTEVREHTVAIAHRDDDGWHGATELDRRCAAAGAR